MNRQGTRVAEHEGDRPHGGIPLANRFRHATLCGLLISMWCLSCTGSSDPGIEWQLGQSPESEGWRVTVHSLSPLPNDPYRQPSNGRVFVAVQLTLENHSPRIRYVMPEQQMILVDGDNHAYAPDREAAVIAARTLGWLIPEGEFPPGAIGKGAISYQIPIGTKDLRWVFHTALCPAAPTMTFALGDAP